MAKGNTMKTIEINLKTHSYQILIELGLLDRAGEIIQPVLKGEKVAVISDETVWKLYGERLISALELVKIKHEVIIIPEGEQSKSINYFKNVCERFAQMELMRTDLVIAFGGGVVGDLAGFSAASYMRGISYVQIPTTLLAQVDSAIGGKTGVNLGHGKNLVGAFWQPELVISDPGLLRTLDSRQFSGGMAEVIKYGAIASERLFYDILGYRERRGAISNIEKIVYQCCEIKSKIVVYDELDLGERMKLNFGHTFGHAIEKLGGFKTYNHGEAVALGMLMASKVGENLGITAKGCYAQLSKVLDRYDLPTDDKIDIKELVPFIINDKKNSKIGVNFILLKDIGSSTIHMIEVTKLRNMLESEV